MVASLDARRFPGLRLVLQTDREYSAWEVFSVFEEIGTKYYYWIGEIGGPSNNPLDKVTKSDLTRGTKQELYRAMRGWLETESEISPDERTVWLEEISYLD